MRLISSSSCPWSASGELLSQTRYLVFLFSMLGNKQEVGYELPTVQMDGATDLISAGFGLPWLRVVSSPASRDDQLVL